MTWLIRTGSTWPSVLGVLTTMVFHTCSASVRTVYCTSDLGGRRQEEGTAGQTWGVIYLRAALQVRHEGMRGV